MVPALVYQKKPQLTFKKFCLFISFGAFATHLIYLGELTQIKYTAVRNKTIHYSQFVEDYLHSSSNKSELTRNRTRIMTAYYAMKKYPARSENHQMTTVDYFASFMSMKKWDFESTQQS